MDHPHRARSTYRLGKGAQTRATIVPSSPSQAYTHLVKMLYRSPQSKYFLRKSTRSGAELDVHVIYKRCVYELYDDLLSVMTSVPPTIADQLHADDAFILAHSRALRDRTGQRTTSVYMIGNEHPDATPIVDATLTVYAAIHAKLPDSEYLDKKM